MWTLQNLCSHISTIDAARDGRIRPQCRHLEKSTKQCKLSDVRLAQPGELNKICVVFDSSPFAVMRKYDVIHETGNT